MDLRLLLVQSVHALLQKTGRGGSFPGSLALKMDPKFLSKFTLPKIVVIVTGTNGKTTTSNLIAEAFRACGLKTINNHRGDNLNVGIATLLASNSDASFHVKADAAVIEVDELTVYRQFQNLHPTTLVVNNFFRDQLDRAGEMETIIRKIESVIENFDGNLILNGNDPNVCRLADSANKAKVFYFGVDATKNSVTSTNEASEGKFCPRCGNPLHYHYYQYSHIGEFVCEKDGFGTQKNDLQVQNVDENAQTFQVEGDTYPSFINTIYGIYNCAAVLCTMKANGLPMEKAKTVFQTYQLNEGRNEVFALSKPCTINLIKNPTGANEVMKWIVQQPEPKNICIILNDNDQDGHDVSWIWDAHFERLHEPNIKTIVCSGLRAYDIALRLKYEDCEDHIKVIENVKDAVAWLDQQDMVSDVICTYTALHSTRAILRKQVQK